MNEDSARDGLSQDDSAWVPDVRKGVKPVYLAIADAIAGDVRTGRLAPGQRLPPQRLLADQLGLDFTTVARAYSEARQRGLVDARVGQGTFVRPPAAGPGPGRVPTAAGGVVDMTMNVPPDPQDAALAERMRQGLVGLGADFDPRALLRYQDGAGLPADRAAGVEWLRHRLPGLGVERVLVCSGTQGALLAALTTLARPGDAVCCEALTYPGFKALAAQLGVRLVGLALDADGIDPAAFQAACAEHRPKALYCGPTLHNPTTLVMPRERREAIAAVARRHGVLLIEDDIYGPLVPSAPPPFGALAPDITLHIAGLAKCVAPGLRVAYLVAPDPRHAARLAAGLRATTLMASPLGTALATRWIGDGTAEAILAAVRREAVARQRLAADILGAERGAAWPEAFHIWLRLPEVWTRAEFATHLRTQGLAVVTSDAFAVTRSPPEAVRIGLGAAAGRDDLRWVLETVADALDQSPAVASTVV